MRRLHQALPSSGAQRESLRQKGQFWTPDWVAEAMVGYVIGGNARTVFDPAVGAGAFFHAAKNVADKLGRNLELAGTEIDPAVLQHALSSGLSAQDIAEVQIRDFVLQPPVGSFEAIVANPPYIRHHRLSPEVKSDLKRLSCGLLGTALDGRAGYHVYFLLRALQLLSIHGRLAFIMPADTCEGVFADKLWSWITSHYRLEAVVTFAAEATPFPKVDTNAVVFLIKNAPPVEHFQWARCHEPHTPDLSAWVLSWFEDEPSGGISVCKRLLSEGLRTGLSRPPSTNEQTGPTLGDYARVLRGIATGANDFFFMTAAKAAAHQIPEEFLLRAIGRTRDVNGGQINRSDVEALDKAGRPTFLLSLDGRPREHLPPPLQTYLDLGEAQQIHQRILIATRRPWYRMEVRSVPPILFAYLGRRSARFILNRADVTPLTGFLCIYPRAHNEPFIGQLWEVLNHPATVANLVLVGKSYGDGAVKVEPRALERLPLPLNVVAEAGLMVPSSQQGSLILA